VLYYDFSVGQVPPIAARDRNKSTTKITQMEQLY
jgi:hypothetical protein